MATFNKFDSFVEAAMEKKHNLGSDTLKYMLSNVAPVAGNSIKTDITEIAAGNGYTAGGTAVAITSSSQTGGTYSLVPTADVVFTASGGSIASFRYVVFYNDTAANDELISWFDYGSSIAPADTETFTVDVGATLLTLA